MLSSVSHALGIIGTAFIVVLSTTALYAQDGTPAPMGLSYRSAFDTATEPPADIVEGATDGMEVMMSSDRASGPAAAAAPPASATPALVFGSVIDNYERYEEAGDPDWVAANNDAAAAGGWQAYATDLYRANKARAEAEKALGADSQSDSSAGASQ